MPHTWRLGVYGYRVGCGWCCFLLTFSRLTTQGHVYSQLSEYVQARHCYLLVTVDILLLGKAISNQHLMCVNLVNARLFYKQFVHSLTLSQQERVFSPDNIVEKIW